MKKKIFTGKLTKKDQIPPPGGGSEGGLAKDHTFSGFFFRHTPLRYDKDGWGFGAGGGEDGKSGYNGIAVFMICK